MTQMTANGFLCSYANFFDLDGACGVA